MPQQPPLPNQLPPQISQEFLEQFLYRFLDADNFIYNLIIQSNLDPNQKLLLQR
ncbi:2197_t:CDS:1 [Dentiscutata heterogama]|uniref:2197_t:CDS:1 n=1 Tax=Dentiscutata heterogama TaxID=1316150 RepID=A0ACA9KMT4_9GLOM|nr:2197_t:CDS:1 [Dentiscutata heterogama]